MAKTFVFGIGGTGARVLRSAAMLFAAGCDNTSSGNIVVPIIIDYDLENGDTKRTLELLQTYQKINEAAYNQNDAGLNTFFCQTVRKLKDFVNGGEGFDSNTTFEVFLRKPDDTTTFGKRIGFETLKDESGTTATGNLLKSLYDNSDVSSPTTELQMNLKKGFKGCPNIGSVVTKDLERSFELQTFINQVVAGDRIIIVGSVFGGTGASGIPMLLDFIRKQPALGDIPVAVIAVMPYFKVRPEGGSAIDSSTFTAKTKAALDAYSLGNSVNKKASAVYYVGDYRVNGSFQNVEGGIGQKNNASFIEIVAAMYIIHFMNTVHVPKVIGTNAEAFEFFLKEISEALKQKGYDGTTIILDRLFEGETLEPYIYPLMRLMLFVRFCRDYYFTTKEGDKNDIWLRNSGLKNKADFKKNLTDFAEKFLDWVVELQDGQAKRGMDLFKNLKDGEGYKEIFTDLKTSQRRCGITNDFITIGNVRSKLGNEYNNGKSADEESNNNDNRSEYFFLTAADKVMRDLFVNVLKKQK